MTDKEIISIADNFLSSNIKLDVPYILRFVLLHQHSTHVWSVAYKIIMKDSSDAVVDGPMVVMVDTITKEARFLG